MKDYEIKFAITRANELSRELMLRDENDLKKADTQLFADAFAAYGQAILAGEAAEDLDDATRHVVADYADGMAHEFQRGRIAGLGPTDSEFLARALTWYARELSAKLELADA